MYVRIKTLNKLSDWNEAFSSKITLGIVVEIIDS